MNTPPSTPPLSPEPELAALFKAQYDKFYEITHDPAFIADLSTQPKNAGSDNSGHVMGQDGHASVAAAREANREKEKLQEAEDGFEFRLFAPRPAAKKTADADGSGSGQAEETVTRIQLIDDGDDGVGGEGAFVGRGRKEEFYFAAPATGKKKEEFEMMAVSGEEVQGQLTVRYKGLEVPWKVRTLRVKGKTWRLKDDNGLKACIAGTMEGEVLGKKKKPGKKRRIVLRTRMKEIAEEKEKRSREAREKEEREKEKKKRLNGLKRAKKRAKDKARKAGGATVTGDTAEGGADDNSD